MTDRSNRIITPQELEGVNITAANLPPGPIFSVGGNGTPKVTMHRDGSLEFSTDHDPDEAARAFWEAVQRSTPDAMTQEFGATLKARINAELAAGEKTQKQVQRLDQMAAAWKDRLPATINRDTVVEAIHHVTRPDGENGPGDPRQAAYDAVFAYIRQRPRDFLPATVVDRNAMIWHAVHVALDACGIPKADTQREEER